MPSQWPPRPRCVPRARLRPAAGPESVLSRWKRFHYGRPAFTGPERHDDNQQRGAAERSVRRRHGLAARAFAAHPGQPGALASGAWTTAAGAAAGMEQGRRRRRARDRGRRRGLDVLFRYDGDRLGAAAAALGQPDRRRDNQSRPLRRVPLSARYHPPHSRCAYHADPVAHGAGCAGVSRRPVRFPVPGDRRAGPVRDHRQAPDRPGAALCRRPRRSIRYMPFSGGPNTPACRRAIATTAAAAARRHRRACGRGCVRRCGFMR